VYPVTFTQVARLELIEAQDWYEREAAGLGRRFRDAINTLVGRMSDNPRQFPIVIRTRAAPCCGVFLIRYSS
jgi:hypothetical protein